MGISGKIQHGQSTPSGKPKSGGIPKPSPKNVTPKQKGAKGGY